MEINKIYNEDCIVTMNYMVENNIHPNIILTSPPYNTARHSSCNKDKRLQNYEMRYSEYEENKTLEEYNEWMIDIFNHYNDVLADNGVVLFNISYGAENPNQLWLLLADIINKTNFMIADTIVWKKSNALPNNQSPNKLTRLCEFVFVICRKSEYHTYIANKTISSVAHTGQKFYNSIYNIIEAKNNDGVCKYNKATFSENFVLSLLKMYCPNDQRESNILVYDSFMGTGTTAIGCVRYGVNYIGSEISKEQCNVAKQRLNGISLSDISKGTKKQTNTKLF
jgi:DNA modification methylase